MQKTITIIGGALYLAAAPAPARANLCTGNYVETEHRQEARELIGEPYSAGSSCAAGSTTCFVGTPTYNEQVIACNRNRDVRPFGLGPVKDLPLLHKAAGKTLDKRTAAERKFADTLPPRFVTGEYQYFGNWDKRYGYLLERKAKKWIATAALDFQFPKAEGDKVHLPVYLARRLSTQRGGASLATGVCATASTGRNDNGMIQVRDSGNTLFSRACRVDKSTRLFLVRSGTYLPASLGTDESRPATEWIMHLWREALTRIWSRPDGSFQLRVWIANLAGRSGEMEDSDLDLFRRNDALYPVELHHDETRMLDIYRPVTVLGVKIAKAIYEGEFPFVVAHEFGHSLGLDDEYAQDGTPRPNKDCQSLSGFSSALPERAYLMCSDEDFTRTVTSTTTTTGATSGTTTTGAGGSAAAPLTSFPDDLELEQHTVKSVYLWLVTQRYSIGRDVEHCRSDDDCAKSQYCKDSVLAVNRCSPRRAAGQGCTADHQCAPPAICTPKPFGKCIVEGSRAIGEPCFNGAECTTNNCDKGLCACSEDDHCAGNQFCDKGTLTVGQNRCVAKKALGVACSRGQQCGSNCCRLHNFKVQCRPTNLCN